MAIKIRKAHDRGYFDYGWLKTFHTFAFGQYENPEQKGFRALRAINENKVAPGVGFPLHMQRDMEIISIVLSGGIAHQDDMGNGSILRPGYVQLMSAGTGVTHSETNASDKEEACFLQIWMLPDAKRLQPSYREQFFPDENKKNKWCLIVSKSGREQSLGIHQDVELYLSDLDTGSILNRQIADQRYGWLQVIEGSIELNGNYLESGDGAAIAQTSQIEIKAQSPAKILFFDLN